MYLVIWANFSAQSHVCVSLDGMWIYVIWYKPDSLHLRSFKFLFIIIIIVGIGLVEHCYLSTLQVKTPSTGVLQERKVCSDSKKSSKACPHSGRGFVSWKGDPQSSLERCLFKGDGNVKAKVDLIMHTAEEESHESNKFIVPSRPIAWPRWIPPGWWSDIHRYKVPRGRCAYLHEIRQLFLSSVLLLLCFFAHVKKST